MTFRKPVLVVMLCAVAVSAPAAAAKGPPDVLRGGGPSAPADSKFAVLGSDRNLARKHFTVVDQSGAKVLSGKLTKAPGKPDPFKRAFRANLTALTAPGKYVVKAAGLKSRSWTVAPGATSPGIQTILGFFAMNADGTEAPAALHGPAHLNDALVKGGGPIPITGGWMDSGDMIHFTQTTAYNAMMLEASARLLPAGADRTAVAATSDVGIHWLEKAHPSPGVFIGQVGDERDHDIGFRDPAEDDASSKPGIGTRVAYPLQGGDLGGKAAAALAMAADRATGPERAALIAQAQDWYEMGKASGRAAPSVDGFYEIDGWKDSLASGGAALFRVTGNPAYLADALAYLKQTDVSGDLGYDSVASFAAAELCGALGAPGLGDAATVAASCKRFDLEAQYARDTVADNAFGRAGYFSWGTTAASSGSGAVAALGGRSLGTPQGLSAGASARDYLFGRNPWGMSFVVGYGHKSPQHPHHWASVFGKGKPGGAVEGGPAPLNQITGEGFKAPSGPLSKFDSKRAAYEDRRQDYVTAEPTGDSAASSILLLSALS
ncbi:MAG: endoglucanase [Thermoleophilaceae bacterium]|nr:endoglucanase [Thermoleophilaceae bacterium]